MISIVSPQAKIVIRHMMGEIPIGVPFLSTRPSEALLPPGFPMKKMTKCATAASKRLMYDDLEEASAGMRTRYPLDSKDDHMANERSDRGGESRIKNMNFQSLARMEGHYQRR